MYFELRKLFEQNNLSFFSSYFPPLCSPSRNYQALDLRIELNFEYTYIRFTLTICFSFVHHMFVLPEMLFQLRFFFDCMEINLDQYPLDCIRPSYHAKKRVPSSIKIIEEWILKTEMAYSTTLSKESSPSSSYYFIIILFVLITLAQSGRNETTLPKKILIRWMEIYTLSNTCL